MGLFSRRRSTSTKSLEVSDPMGCPRCRHDLRDDCQTLGRDSFSSVSGADIVRIRCGFCGWVSRWEMDAVPLLLRDEP